MTGPGWNRDSKTLLPDDDHDDEVMVGIVNLLDDVHSTLMTTYHHLSDLNVRKRGAPLRMWHSAAETFCRWKGVANWKTTAMNREDWYKYTSEFCSFILQS